MKNRNDTHAPCPVRYREGGADLCGATDTPCEYCADREPNSPAFLSCARRRNPRRNRNATPFEDS